MNNMSLTCPNCGEEIDDDSIFCPECGMKSSDLFKECPNCGKQIDVDSEFCNYCGVSLKSNEEFKNDDNNEDGQGEENDKNTENLNREKEQRRFDNKPILIILSILAIVSVVLAASSFLPIDDTIDNPKNIEPSKPEIIITSDCEYGNAPLTVNFSCTCNNFTKNITSYRWDFDDGNSYSSLKNATWIFEKDGIYEVTLMVSYVDLFSGDSVTNETNTFYSEPYQIEVINERPTAKATANITIGSSIPCTISFSGSGEDDGSISSYHWDFGEGSISTKKNPQHTFTEYGTYTVELTVTDNLGKSDTDSFTVKIKNRFDLTGKIVNDYSETVDVDYIIYSSGDWYDLGGTVFDIGPGEKDSFTLDVKGGISSYTLIVGWFYPYTDTQVDRVDYDFTNPSGEDLVFDIKINTMGEIEVILK